MFAAWITIAYIGNNGGKNTVHEFSPPHAYTASTAGSRAIVCEEVSTSKVLALTEFLDIKGLAQTSQAKKHASNFVARNH